MRGRSLVVAFHLGIIAMLVAQLAYVGFVFWVVLAPEGAPGPLGTRAATVDLDLLVRRRLYALEGWLGFGILVLYLGLTEIGPRLRAHREEAG